MKLKYDEVLKQIDFYKIHPEYLPFIGLNFEKGVIDPASVAISTITNAISIAGIFLTTEAAITIEETKKITDDDLM